MSIAASPETSCSITHFHCKKDFFYNIQYGVMHTDTPVLSEGTVLLTDIIFVPPPPPQKKAILTV